MSNETEDLTKLLSSAALVLLGSIIGSFSKLIERVIIGRLLSPAAYGEFSIASTIFTVGAILGAAGFIQGVPRFMPRFETDREIRGVWYTGIGIPLILSSLLVLILLAASTEIVPLLFESPQSSTLYTLFVLGIPVYVVFRITVGGIRGQENTPFKVLTEDLCYPLLRVGLIVGLLLTGWNVIGTGIAYLVSLTFAAIFAVYLLNRLLPIVGQFELHTKPMVTFSLPLVISTAISIMLTRTDTLMLGYFSSSTEVGIYSAAYPLAGVLTVVLGAFGYMYLPVASRIDNNEEGSVEEVYETTTKWIYLLVFPLFVMLLVFPSDILAIVFGSEYTSGAVALAILSIGFFTNAAVGRSRETLSAVGATKFIMIANLITFILNIIFNVILIPAFGITGAAIASASSYFTMNFFVCLFLKYKFGITPFNRNSLKIVAFLPAAVIPPIYLVSQTLPRGFLVLITSTISITFFTVIVVVAIGGLEKNDVVIIEFIEGKIGMRVPIIRKYISD